MENHELKALINTPHNTGPLKAGDRVRIIPREQVSDPRKSPIYTQSMSDQHAGEIHTIESVGGVLSHIQLRDAHWAWHADWLERV